MDVQRCTKCLLPRNYPAVEFNSSGECLLCANHKERTYLGDEALREKILSYADQSVGKERKYDCILGLSGGRDSSYLLWYLTKDLGLRVLCYSVDNGFAPEVTKENIRKMAEKTGVDLIMERSDYLNDVVRKHINNWMKKPTTATIGMFCTGCRLGIDKGTLDCAVEHRVPIIISGATPFEGQGYKFNLMRLDPNDKNSSFALGYLKQILFNPRWVMSPTSDYVQLKEYYYHYYLDRRLDKYGGYPMMRISPFYHYHRWEEDKIVSTIQDKLGWKKRPDIASTWRGDCDIALLKLYLYKRFLGFNDKDDGLSALVRDGQLSRDEGLARLAEESDVSDDLIKQIFKDLKLDCSALMAAVAKVQARNS